VFVFSSRTTADRTIAVLLGITLIFAGLVLTRPILSFGFFFCLLFGAGMIAMAKYKSPAFNDFLIQSVGLICCMHSYTDIIFVAFFGSEESDPVRLADITGVPGIIWGMLWIIVATMGFYYILRLTRNSIKTCLDVFVGETEVTRLWKYIKS
jgi:hypothetical protein